MTTEQIAQQIAAIRMSLDRADSYPPNSLQIGSIIIALLALTNVVEDLAAKLEETHE